MAIVPDTFYFYCYFLEAQRLNALVLSTLGGTVQIAEHLPRSPANRIGWRNSDKLADILGH